MEIDFSKKICYLLFLVKFLYENIYKEFLRVAEAHQIIDMQTFKLSGLFFFPLLLLLHIMDPASTIKGIKIYIEQKSV